MVEQIAVEEPRDAAREGALADIELNLLLEGVHQAAGYDFRGYSPRTLKRRVADRLRAEGLTTISALQDRVLHDQHAMAQFVRTIAGSGNRLFDDPTFFRAFREHLVPLLRTYSFARLWIPNCGRAEEAYALAVLLEEEGLLDRSMIYATDISELSIAEAKRGQFEVPSMPPLEAAFAATSSQSPLSAFATFSGGQLTFNEHLKRNIVFAQHSLVDDASLNEFHVIVTRNLLDQFSRAVQYKVYNVLVGSLLRLGFLCLGHDETLRNSPYEKIFRPFPSGDSIYRRMR